MRWNIAVLIDSNATLDTLIKCFSIKHYRSRVTCSCECNSPICFLMKPATLFGAFIWIFWVFQMPHAGQCSSASNDWERIGHWKLLKTVENYLKKGIYVGEHTLPYRVCTKWIFKKNRMSSRSNCSKSKTPHRHMIDISWALASASFLSSLCLESIKFMNKIMDCNTTQRLVKLIYVQRDVQRLQASLLVCSSRDFSRRAREIRKLLVVPRFLSQHMRASAKELKLMCSATKIDTMPIRMWTKEKWMWFMFLSYLLLMKISRRDSNTSWVCPHFLFYCFFRTERAHRFLRRELNSCVPAALGCE